jgi:hypothetical protein
MYAMPLTLKSGSRQREIFLDNNLSPKVARALNALLEPEHSAHHLKDLYPAGTLDEVWMRDLGNQTGWVILSGDSAISRNPHEVRAWKEAGHPIFFLKPAWAHLPAGNRPRSYSIVSPKF